MSKAMEPEPGPWEAQRDLARSLWEQGRTKEALSCLHDALLSADDPEAKRRLRSEIFTRVCDYYSSAGDGGYVFLGGLGTLLTYAAAQRRLDGLDPRIVAIYKEEARRERPLGLILGIWMVTFIPAVGSAFVVSMDPSMRPETPTGWLIIAGLAIAALVTSCLLVRWAIEQYRKN